MWDTERLSESPQITQKVKSRPRTETNLTEFLMSLLVLINSAAFY